MKRNTKKMKLFKQKNKTQPSQTFHLDQEQHQTALKAKLQLEKYSSSCGWSNLSIKNHSDVIKNWDQSISQPVDSNQLQSSQFQRSSELKYRKLNVAQVQQFDETNCLRKNISCFSKGTKILESSNPSSGKSFRAISTNFDFDKIFNHQQAKRSTSILIENLKRSYRPLTCKKKVVLKTVITVQPFSENYEIHTTPKVKQITQTGNPKQFVSYQMHKHSLKYNFNRKTRIKNFHQQQDLEDTNDELNYLSYLTSNQQSARKSKTPNKLNQNQKKRTGQWIQKEGMINRVYKAQSQYESPLKQQFQRLTKLIRQQVNSLGYSGYNPIYIKQLQ